MQLNTLSMVHDFLKRSVQPGAFCIDATAGKGRDTALLCRLARETGRVLAFDVQPEAVAQTKALLTAEHLTAEVILDSHANMERYAAAGTADCIVFNFGRLPGGDPSIFTQADSSVAALEAALRLLKPGGVIAVALYYGGANGYGEREPCCHGWRGWTTGGFPCSAVIGPTGGTTRPCPFLSGRSGRRDFGGAGKRRSENSARWKNRPIARRCAFCYTERKAA